MKTKFALMLSVSIILSCNNPQNKIADTSRNENEKQNYGCCVPEILDTAWYSSGKTAPLFSGLDGIRFPITTTNPKAQKYFEQGMMLAFGFNHAEAGRSFYESIRQDTSCAMCWWGFAYVLGPNYNAGMEPDNYIRAAEAISHARKLSTRCTRKEKDLIEAMSTRYSTDTLILRPFLDSSYSAAMKPVFEKYPDDINISTMYAESIMDLHPWDLYTKEGKAHIWTPEIIDVLEISLKKAPSHAGANHLYIHAVEMSQTAERALASADLLRDLVPGSGHLVHMPSHVYIRIGRYHDGVIANQKAVLVDSLYFVACHAQGVYPLAYYPHNHHFLSACATLSGESNVAITGAIATARHAHKKLLHDPAWATLQHYYSIPWYVQVKLGQWEEIIQSIAPEKELKYPLIIWNYAQGMAMLSKNKTSKALEHLIEIKSLMKDTSLKELTIWGINNVFDLCEIASNLLEAEIKAKEKKYDEAIILSKRATKIEDSLNYDEPPDWFFSTRHTLGALFLESGKYQEAKTVFEEDLKIYRENGWALKGLMNAYKGLNDQDNYVKTKSRFEKAWKYADIKINSSRIL